MKLKDLLRKADERELAERRTKAESKQGVLRAGNSGILLDNGDVLGACHRKTMARTLGLEAETIPSESTQGFFAAGFAHELWVINKILDVLPKDYILLCEEEIPIAWTTTNGTPVTGRPDVVICKQVKEESGFKDKPVFGIELKALAAANSAAGVKYRGPKTDHLIQAMHYMIKLGLDSYSLFYSYMASAQMPWWVKKEFPIEYEKNLLPFRKEYHLEFNAGGYLTFTDEDGSMTTTLLTASGLSDYYDLVADMIDKKDMFRRPADKDYAGNRMPYSGCNYCPHKSACDQYEGNYDRWVDELRKNKLLAEDD